MDLDEQLRTPLFDAMVALAESRKVSFHTPAHKSVLAGLILSGAQPIFYSPPVDERLHIMLNVTFDETKAAIDAHPECKVLFLTSPNYYGICADLERIVPYAHEKGLTVLVDEAHGPHLKFHPDHEHGE